MSIIEIPQFIIDAAKKSYSETDLVIFIGAGFSRIMGLPGWNQYAKIKLEMVIESKEIDIDFATRTYYQGLANSDPKLLLSLLHTELIRQGVKKNDLSQFEKLIFHLDDDKILSLKREYNELINALKRINAFYITTNYDNILESVFGFEKYVFTGGRINTRKGQVWHIHGDIANSKIEIVSSNQDYFKMYYQEKEEYFGKVREQLKNIFLNKSILFIGYGLGEMEILQFLFEGIDKDDYPKHRHAILETLFSNTSDELLKNYYSDLGISLLTLSKDKRGYKIIHDTLIEWAEKLEMININIIPKGLR